MADTKASDIALGDSKNEPEFDIGNLRTRVVNAMIDQEFVLRGKKVVLPGSSDKAVLRIYMLPRCSIGWQIARPGLARHEDRLLSHIANGHEIDPERIRPRLVEVSTDSDEVLLFRYALPHWNIPVFAGYHSTPLTECFSTSSLQDIQASNRTTVMRRQQSPQILIDSPCIALHHVTNRDKCYIALQRFWNANNC